MHFPYRHKTSKVNHCCSHGTVKKKKKKRENQPIIVCTELKIVINRACLKENKQKAVAFFSCIKENL